MKKASHQEEDVPKRPPRKQKVAKRPPYGEKSPSLEEKRSIKPSHGKKVSKRPPIQRKTMCLFFQGVGERLLLHPLRVSMHNSLCLGLLIHNETYNSDIKYITCICYYLLALIIEVHKYVFSTIHLVLYLVMERSRKKKYSVTQMMFVVIQLIISHKEIGSRAWPPAREQA